MIYKLEQLNKKTHNYICKYIAYDKINNTFKLTSGEMWEANYNEIYKEEGIKFCLVDNYTVCGDENEKFIIYRNRRFCRGKNAERNFRSKYFEPEIKVVRNVLKITKISQI